MYILYICIYMFTHRLYTRSKRTSLRGYLFIVKTWNIYYILFAAEQFTPVERVLPPRLFILLRSASNTRYRRTTVAWCYIFFKHNLWFLLLLSLILSFFIAFSPTHRDAFQYGFASRFASSVTRYTVAVKINFDSRSGIRLLIVVICSTIQSAKNIFIFMIFF